MFFIINNSFRMIKCMVVPNFYETSEPKQAHWSITSSLQFTVSCSLHARGRKDKHCFIFQLNLRWPLLIPLAVEYYKWLMISLTLTCNIMFCFALGSCTYQSTLHKYTFAYLLLLAIQPLTLFVTYVSLLLITTLLSTLHLSFKWWINSCPLNSGFMISMLRISTSRLIESQHHDIGCHIKCVSNKTPQIMWIILRINVIIFFWCMSHFHCEWFWWTHTNHITGCIINVISMFWGLSSFSYYGLHCEWDQNAL